MPVQDANRFRSANLMTSPTSAKIRAATTGPTPGRSISLDPRASTIALSSLVRALIFFSTATNSLSCSTASLRRVFPARSRGRTEARIALACKAVMSCLARPGVSSESSRCNWLTV